MVMHVDGVLELFSFLGVNEIMQQRRTKGNDYVRLNVDRFVGFGNTCFFFFGWILFLRIVLIWQSMVKIIQ